MGSAVSEPKRATAKPAARGRLRRVVQISGGALLALGAIGFAAPYVAVAHGTKRVTACFAAYEAPRAAAPPACYDEIRWLITPSRLPWTRHAASYRGEEIAARTAVLDYRDAIIGMPDRARIHEAAKALERAAQIVESGSKRLAFDDLGPDIGTPNLSRAADLLGDRATLLEGPERSFDWHIRLHTLQAALIEGDVPRAISIAKRYAEFDHRDEDLRSAIGALLCMGEDARRGVDLLALLQNDRAARKYAGMSRNWGDVRAVMVACGAKAGFLPPPKPEDPEAGQGLPMTTRALLRLRLARPEPADPIEAREREAALSGALKLLGDGSEEGGWSDDSAAIELRIPRMRISILAAILASDRVLTPAEVIRHATPPVGAGELPLLPSRAITAIDWMRDPAGQEPWVQPATIERASARALAIRAGEVGEEVSEAEAKALGEIAGALLIEAARVFARSGDAASAVHAIERAGQLFPWEKAGIALARSSARFVNSDIEGALRELDGDPLLTVGGAEGADPTAKLLRAAGLIQRAELLAAQRSRDPDRAHGPAAKAAFEAAIAADQAAAAAGDPALDARARWTRLALARAEGAPPLRPGTEVDIQARLSAALASRSPLAADGSPDLDAPVYRGTGPDRPWSWVGEIPAGVPWAGPPPAGGPALSALLSLWNVARVAPADERRALRYMLLRARADSAASPLAELELVADLLGDQGDREIWIDAFTAIDARVMSRRSFTWLRSMAARWRGDEAAAARWKRAYDALCEVASDPARAEIARFLGI